MQALLVHIIKRDDCKIASLFFAGKCSRFTYSGCGGNPNNFQSLASCQATCGAVGEYGSESRTDQSEPDSFFLSQATTAPSV